MSDVVRVTNNELGYVKLFRVQAYNISPEFGREIDAILMQNVGMGEIPPGDYVSDPNSLLNKLTAGLTSAATAVNLSAKAYFDAMTSINMMKAANKAGVPVDQYVAQSAVGKGVGVVLGSGQVSFGAIPVWALIAGGAALVYIIASRR